MVRILQLVPLVIATALGITACGPTISNEARGIVPGTAVRRDGRLCGQAPVPNSLPSVSRLVDSAAVRRLAGADTVSGDLVFGLRFGPPGELAAVHLLAPPTGAPGADQYLGLIRRTIRTQPSQESVWGMRLRVRTGKQPEVAVQRSEFCQPEPRTGASALSASRTLMTEQDLRDLQNARPARALIHVGADGVVRTVEMIRSSGSGVFDRGVMETWQRGRFLPATLDGVPIAAEYEAEAAVRIRGG